MHLKSLLHSTLDTLLPAYCLVCKKRLRQGQVCSKCRNPELSVSNLDQSLRCKACFSPKLNSLSSSTCQICQYFPLNLDRVRYLWEYNDTSKAYINAMKYKPSIRLCQLAGQVLAEHLIELFKTPGWDLIVPIASSKQALKSRGFNQCILLVKKISKMSKTKTAMQALTHHGYKAPQASLPHKKRIYNIKSALSCSSKFVWNKNILLVDDVVTTGATSAQAAKALLEAGANKVDLVSLTRAPCWVSNRYRVFRGFGGHKS